MRYEKANARISSIEKKARQLLGYDRESLNREMDQAEEEWEARKRADPTLEEKTKQETEASFQKLMARVWEKGIQIDHGGLRSEYRSNVMETSHRSFRLKGYGRILLVAALLMALVSGMGISAVANRKFALQKMKSSSSKQELQWSDNQYIFELDNLEQSYQSIKEVVNVKPIKLNYIPAGMNFSKLTIDDNRATLVFLYENKYIYVTQSKPEAYKVSEGVTSDRDIETVATNKRLNHDFIVNENILSDGIVEYSTAWETENAFYQFLGIMEKEEFIKMIEDLDYYK